MSGEGRMAKDRGKRRWKRIALWAAAIMVVVLVALVAMGPLVASRFAPGFIESAANGSIRGSVEVEGVSLSWLGPQRFGPVTLRDPDGGTVGVLEARVGSGLLGLALGGRDLGEINVKGDLGVVRGVDGRTNLERAVEARAARPAGEAGGPARMPRGLAGRVSLSNLSVTYRDESSGAAVSVSGFGGTVVVRPGLEVEGELSGRVEAGGESGSVTISLRAGGLTDATGMVTPERAEAEASVRVEGLPVSIADALAGEDGVLASVLGGSVSGLIEVTYAGGEASAEASLSTPNSSLEVGVAGTRERARLTRPLVARLRMEGVPGAYLERFGREMVDPSVASIVSMPVLELRVDEAEARVPSGGAFDLRGSRIAGSISTTEMEVREAGGRQLRVEPMTLTFGSEDLGGPVRVRGSTTALIDGRGSGEISLDAVAEGLLDEGGAVRATGPTGVTGVLRVEGLDMSVLQPFVSGLGVDLERDVGRVLSVAVTAEAEQGDGGPTVVVGVEGEAEHLRVTGEARGRGAAWEVTRAIEARVDRAGDLLASLAERGGVGIESASGAAIRVEAGSKFDAASGMAAIRAALTLDEMRGTVRAGDAVHAMAVRGLRASAFADGSGSMGGEVEAGLSLDGHAIERFAASATVEGVSIREPDLARAKARGRVEAVGVPSELLQRFVPTEALDVRHVIGVGMDLVASLEPWDGGATAGLPASVATIEVKSEATTGGGRILIADGAISTVGEGVLLRDVRYGAIARPHLTAAGIEVAPEAIGSVRVFDVRVPLREGFRPELEASSASVEVGSTTMWVGREGAARVRIPRLTAGGSLAAGGTARAWLDATMEQGESSFWVGGDVTVPGLVQFEGGAMSLNTAFVPTGGLKARDVPASMLGVVSGVRVGGRSLEEVAREALGGAASFEVAVVPQPGVNSSRVSVQFDSAKTDVSVTAYILPGEYRVGSVSLESELTPGLLNPFLGSVGRPALRGATRVSAGLTGPIVVPRVGLGVDLSGVQGCRYSVAMPGRAMVGGIALASGDGTTRVVEDAGLENVLVEGWLPLQAVVGGGSGSVAGRLSATMVDAAGRARGKIDGEFMAPLTGLTLTGSSKVVVGVKGLETAWVDALLAKAGLVSGAVGASLDAQTETWIVSASSGEGIERVGTTVTAASPRFSTGEPIRVQYLPDRITLAAPAVSWTAPAEWLNAHALGPESAVRFGEAFQIEAAVKSLTLSRGEGMLRGGVFGVDASLASSRVVIEPEGSAATVLTDVSLTARSQGGGVDVTLGATEGSSRHAVRARATGFADAQGRATFGAMTLTGDAELPGVSVALLDGVLNQNGLLVDALGERVSVETSFREFSREGGTLSASVRSPRAEADISGRARGGVFVADGQPTFKLLEVRPELAARVYRGLPAMGRFEKRRDSGPAIVTFTGLEAPLDGDLSRLQGQVRFEPGVAHFETAGWFQRILRALDQRQAGVAGRRLEPLVVRITDGVARYEPYTIPLGEFNVRSEGSVDLVQRRLDVVTWIPFGALSDEAAGAFSLDLGKAVGGLIPPLERLSMVPFRTHGPLSSPTTGPDMETFVKQMLRPDQLLLPNLGKIFGGGLN